jgi:hypothetical protein
MWIDDAHRALKQSWFDNGELTAKAYRRSPADADGLSVACSHDYAKTFQRSGCGVAAVKLRTFEELGLAVQRTATDPHGLIQGLPAYEDQDFNRALELADRLVHASRVTSDRWRRDE